MSLSRLLESSSFSFCVLLLVRFLLLLSHIYRPKVASGFRVEPGVLGVVAKVGVWFMGSTWLGQGDRLPGFSSVFIIPTFCKSLDFWMLSGCEGDHLTRDGFREEAAGLGRPSPLLSNTNSFDIMSEDTSGVYFDSSQKSKFENCLHFRLSKADSA